MRVLIVYPEMYVYGGAELVVVRLANYMREKGIENAILTTSICPDVQKDLEGIEVIIHKAKVNILSKTFALYKGVRDNLSRFDVINIHNFPAELSVFLCNKPTIWMCNEPQLYLKSKITPSFCKKFILKTFLEAEKFVVRNYIDEVVVSDEFNAKRFKKIYSSDPKIINYGIDYEFFSKADKGEFLDKFNLENNFVVLHVGMLTLFKNQMESIRTIEKVRNEIPRVKLILAGWSNKEYRMKLESYVKEKNLEENVIFTGHLTREQIRNLYCISNVLLHPVKAQGGWLAPFEALSCQKPIVVCSEMTASEIIKREKIGIVTENFAGAILDIYNNPDKYRQMAMRGKKWVRENLNWEKFCEKMLNLFFEVTKKE